MEILLIVLGVIASVYYYRLRDRIDRVDRQLRTSGDAALAHTDQRIEALSRRVAALEGEVGISAQAETPAEPPAPRTDRLEPTIPTVSPPAVVAQAPSPPATEPRGAEGQSGPGPRVAPTPTAAEPNPAAQAPAVAAAAPERRSADDIEALIGGDWLNKLGVLVLVIGLALTLGYSFTYMGPLGRVMIGLAVSVGLLGAGRVLERRGGYRLYGRGLIGGGWAALYFTTYAMHGLDAARVITNPFVGFALLLAVAVAMIASSLRYRSEAVTGIAFTVGFATLAVSPSSLFSIFASVPLAVALLFVAHRFEWVRLAFVGVLVTYGVYVFAAGEALDTGSRLGDFLAGQTVLVLYLVLFEAFDLLRPIHRDLRSESPASGAETLVLGDAIFPLNTTAFVGVSALQWLALDASMLDFFLPLATLLFLASALARARLRPLAHQPSLDPVPRLLVGYAGAAAVSAALGVLAIFQRFSGYSVNVAVLLEAQLLLVCGLYLRRRFLRGLAAAVFAVAGIKLLVFDLFSFSGSTTSARFGLEDWSLMAVVTAAVLYADRAWLRTPSSAPVTTAEKGYSFAATLLMALTILIETPDRFLELWWLGLAVLLLEIGLRAAWSDLRWQAYMVSALAFVVLMLAKVLALPADPTIAWVSVAPGVAVASLMSARLHLAGAARLSTKERATARDSFVVAATALLLGFLWQVLPAPLVALAWGAVALLLIEFGYTAAKSSLRLLGNCVAALAFARLLWTNLWLDGTTWGLPDAVLTVIPVTALAYYLAARMAAMRMTQPSARWEERVPQAYLWIAFPTLLLMVWLEFAALWVAPAWALYCVLLLMAGRRWASADLRVQSHLLLLPVFVICQSLNLEVLGSADHSAVARWGAVGIVVTCLYVARSLVHFGLWRRAGSDTDPDVNPTLLGASLATLLISLTLVHEVDGSLLTVALGIQGTVLMIAGFVLGDRGFRLSGLALLGVCVLKAFAYDLGELDPLFRILSFVVLGLLLLGVSFIYTRYREQLRRFL